MKSMSCQEFVDFLCSYLDDELPDDVRVLFDQHLNGCPPCAAFLQHYELSIKLGHDVCGCPKEAARTPVPEELVQAILEARRGEEAS